MLVGEDTGKGVCGYKGVIGSHYTSIYRAITDNHSLCKQVSRHNVCSVILVHCGDTTGYFVDQREGDRERGRNRKRQREMGEGLNVRVLF
jgi:hypothetical protein